MVEGVGRGNEGILPIQPKQKVLSKESDGHGNGKKTNVGISTLGGIGTDCIGLDSISPTIGSTQTTLVGISKPDNSFGLMGRQVTFMRA